MVTGFPTPHSPAIRSNQGGPGGLPSSPRSTFARNSVTRGQRHEHAFPQT